MECEDHSRKPEVEKEEGREGERRKQKKGKRGAEEKGEEIAPDKPMHYKTKQLK